MNIKNYGYGEETIVGYEQEIKFWQKTLVTRRKNSTDYSIVDQCIILLERNDIANMDVNQIT